MTNLPSKTFEYKGMTYTVYGMAAITFVEKLLGELKEAEKDKERLDYLAAHPRPTEMRITGKPVELGYVYAVAGASVLSLREVIDACIKNGRG